MLEIMDLSTYEWRREKTYGGDNIPYMGKFSYHIVLDDTFYLFGGLSSEYHNDLHKLNLLTFHWKKIFPTSSIPPSPMCEGQAILYGTSMFIFGGLGNPLPNRNSPQGATFERNFSFGYQSDDGWHNALYEYSTVDSKTDNYKSSYFN